MPAALASSSLPSFHTAPPAPGSPCFPPPLRGHSWTGPPHPFPLFPRVPSATKGRRATPSSPFALSQAFFTPCAPLSLHFPTELVHAILRSLEALPLREFEPPPWPPCGELHSPVAPISIPVCLTFPLLLTLLQDLHKGTEDRWSISPPTNAPLRPTPPPSSSHRPSGEFPTPLPCPAVSPPLDDALTWTLSPYVPPVSRPDRATTPVPGAVTTPMRVHRRAEATRAAAASRLGHFGPAS
jgi:hypothetical protein